MAVQETRVLPPQFIQDLATDYGKQLTALTAQPIDTAKFAPTVATQDPLQTQAATLAAIRYWCLSTVCNGSTTSSHGLWNRDHGSTTTYRHGSWNRSRFYCFFHVALPTTSYRYNISRV